MNILSSLHDISVNMMESPIYILIMLLAATTVLFIILNIQIGKELRIYRKLLKGVQGDNLEKMIQGYTGKCETLEDRLGDLETFVEDIHKQSQQYFRGIGMIRFNAFEDMGGKQSFSIALLDSRGDGIVLTNLYGREESRVYAKSIKGGLSEYSLSQEERDAVKHALMLQK